MMQVYPIPESEPPALTAAQMLEVDRLMVEVYGVTLLQMMENASRCLAALARVRFLSGDPRGKGVVVLAGTGGNGGGALAAGRRLHTWGARVQVFLSRPPEALAPAPGQQLRTLQRLGVPVYVAGQQPEKPQADLVLDGLLGYSLRAAPRGGAAVLIEWANRIAPQTPLLALDLPSGLDAGSGEVFAPCIRAAATMTLALPKQGLLAPQAAAVVGELYLADISVPPELYDRLGLQVGPLFAKSEILRLAR